MKFLRISQQLKKADFYFFLISVYLQVYIHMYTYVNKLAFRRLQSSLLHAFLTVIFVPMEFEKLKTSRRRWNNAKSLRKIENLNLVFFLV